MTCLLVLVVSVQANAVECVRNGIGDGNCRPPATSLRPPPRPPDLTNIPIPRPRPLNTISGDPAAIEAYQSHTFRRIPTIDTKSVPGKKIAEAAYKTVGFSTVASDTDGGNKGCAVGVSKILENAGYPIGRITGTGTLFDKLNADDCYDMIHPMPKDASGLMPGDVLVTKATSGKAGHTGVYVGNGNIISNASAGYEGSDPGTVEENYTYGKWTDPKEGVVKRNPGGSAVFRRKESCA